MKTLKSTGYVKWADSEVRQKYTGLNKMHTITSDLGTIVLINNLARTQSQFGVV